MPSVSRRALLLASLPISFGGRSLAQTAKPAAPRAKPLPQRGEFIRYQDPLTETIVTRLTSPASAAVLPVPQNRFISARDRFLVFSSNRGGAFAPFRLDLQTGTARQLAAAQNLDAASLTMDVGERMLFFLDGGTLRACSLTTAHERTLLEDVSQFSLASDVRWDAKAEASALVVLQKGAMKNVNGRVLVPAGETSPIARCLISPDGKLVLLERSVGGETILSVTALGSAASATRDHVLAQGAISFPFWSSDSRHIVYLHGFEIRQISLDEQRDEHLANTTMFAAFAPNRDSSVFVGASRSKAQPAVVLMVRSGSSEMMLCEHRDTTPAAVTPVFSPDSRRIFFQTDYTGNSAIYSVSTETLVDAT